MTVESVTSSSVIVVVALGQRLYSGQSCSFDLKFDLVDNGGSTDRDLRIGNNSDVVPRLGLRQPEHARQLGHGRLPARLSPSRRSSEA